MKRPLAAWVAAAAATAPFLPALGAGFLDWDDKATVVFNGAYRGFSSGHLAWMLAPRHYGPWQPLSWLSYAIDHALWGLDAPAFRRTNLFLHASAAALAASVAWRLIAAALPRVSARARELGAAAAALFFAIHPLRVESVVWITERRDVLSGVFFLAAWLARLEGSGSLSLVLFAGALLSKGTAVALPFFLLATEVYPFRRLSPDPRRWPRPKERLVLRELAPYFLLAALAGGMNLLVLRGGDLQVPAIGFGARLFVAAQSAGFYVLKTFWPQGLSPYYPLPRDWTAAAPMLVARAALAVAVTVAAWRWRRVAPWALPAWLSYLAALAPASGLLQNGAQLTADRYSYLSCLPFAFLVGGAAALFAARRSRGAVVVVVVGTFALGLSSWRQSGFWRDDVALWTRAVALAPEAYLPRSNLAQALFLAGREEEALAQYPEVVRLEPRDIEARGNWALLLEKRGRGAEGERLLSEALALRPGDAQTTTNLAFLLARRGARDQAIGLLTDLAARRPDFAPGRFNLGVLLLSAGRKNEGLPHLREALRLDPGLASKLRGRRDP